MAVSFEWDQVKNIANQQKHRVSFEEAQYAFADDKRIIAEDITHKSSEILYYCFANVRGEIMTVRFTYRNNKIRIFWLSSGLFQSHPPWN